MTNKNSTLWKDLKTPCFIIDKHRLDDNVEKLKKEFSNTWDSPVVYGYSVKTNSLPWIITYMKHKGFFAEVVSEQEYRLVRKLGFEPSEIILNGPIKSESLIVEALNGGAYVNLDNFEEIYALKRCIDQREREWKVGLRYNFLLEDECPEETIVGLEGSRFGFNIENGDIGKAIQDLRQMEGIRIAGLHGHSSTKTKSLRVFKAISRRAALLREEYDLDIEYVDIGGGFFGDKPGAPEYREYAEAIAEFFPARKGLRLIVEPGASLVSSPIGYLSTVVNTRDGQRHRFVTIDGSNIHINPLFHNVNFQIDHLCEDRRESVSSQVICGFTCIEMDRIGILKEEQELKTGDRIFINNCGSYSMTLSPLFISYYPRVYVDDGNEFICVRKEWDENTFMQKCEVFK